MTGVAFAVAPVHATDDTASYTYLRQRSFALEHSLRFLQQQNSSDLNCTQTCCTDLAFCTPASGGSGWISSVPVPVQYMMVVILICMSALFSGLTLGVLSLDLTGLEIVMDGDDPKNAAAARRIYPIRKNGNLLLCSLLLGNVAVNSLVSIILADKAGGVVGFLSSTLSIVIFGEIIPQAACSRYALQVGSWTVPLVRIILVVFYPVAGPMSFCLNVALGEELATTYSSGEMRKLLEIHVKEGRFDHETAGAMAGALKYKDTKVKEVMTPLVHTYMLNVDEKLNFETIAVIFKTGYSRIPVYEISVNNVIGLLFVKDLIFIDPEDETPVRNFVQIFGRGVHVVWPDDTLGDVLRELKQGRSHMALVRDVNNTLETDPFYEIVGIITLEDIIEEIIGAEIVDETDAFVDGTHAVRVNRMENFDWGRLRLLDTKIVDETLSHDETKAVTAHLRTNYSSAVELLTDKQLHRLVSETSITEFPTAVQEVGLDLPSDLLYQNGVGPTNVCTLILSGKVTVLVGADRFRTDLSSWSVLGSSSLSNTNYVPDFTAYVSSGPCRCLQFTREEFNSAVDASAVERLANPGISHAPHSPTLVTSSFLERTFREATDEVITGGDSDPKRSKGQHNRRKKLIAAFQSANKKEEDLEPVTDDIERIGRISFASPSEPASLSNALGGHGSYHAGPRKREAPSEEEEVPTLDSVASRKSSGNIKFIGSPASDKTEEDT